MKSYYSLLDAARFFAAFWVMNFHYLFVWRFTPNSVWYRYGNLGVQLFFMISGFVIIQSLEGKTIREFATSRLIRLFPLFWILCTVTYISTILIPNTNVIYFKEYLISMTMLGDVINTIAHTHLRLVDPSYWTLAVELTFYCAIATFMALFSYKNIRYFFVGWFIISVVAFITRIDENLYTKLFLVQHASYFIFGGSLYLIVSRQAHTMYEKYIDYGLLFLSVVYSVYISSRVIPFYINGDPTESYLVPVVLLTLSLGVAILVYLSRYIKNINTIKILALCGGASYPLYLLHETTGNAVINYITKRFDVSWGTAVIGFEVVIIIVSCAIYIQDKKLRDWLRSKI